MQSQGSRQMFQSIINESVANGLKYAIGEGGLMVLERRFELGKTVSNPETLHETLTSIFSEGAAVLERQIVRQLYEMIGERFVDVPGCTLVAYINSARMAYEAQGRGMN